ncbi:MAG TPA: hypothetical protein VGM91_06660 [Conexibacter sp.]|jgi:hypothetical protein
MSMEAPEPETPPRHPKAPSAAPARRQSLLRRAAGFLVSLAIGLGLVILLLLFIDSRDQSGVDQQTPTTATAPGTAFDAPQQYLDARQLVGLRAGDVYIVSAGARPDPALVALRDQLSGPPDPVLERAGQAVVLVQRAGTPGVVALASTQRLDATTPDDPDLQAFASHWLGHGANGG